MSDINSYILIGGTVIVGLIATVVYYIARYSFKSHDKDPEVLPSIETQSESVKEASEVLKEAFEKAKEEPDKVLEALTETVETKKDVAPTTAQFKAEPKKDLKEALANTKANIFGRIKQSLVGKASLSDDDIELLEEVLYTSDMGPTTVQRLMGAVGTKLSQNEKKELAVVQSAIKSEIADIFSDVHSGDEFELEDVLNIKKVEGKTQVWMIVGVNGAGKTTSIGKLANFVASRGLKVLVAAGDTFRAAAGEQLQTWTERAQVEIFFPENVKDPSAVAFDACQKAKSGGFDLVIVDTAGRLHTQDNLMEELKKMKRVMQKVLPEAPDQTLIVLDANSGQNALMQAKSFNEALELSGAILTKLDGTAKGGVAVGLACEVALPIKAIGVGEGIEDIRPFKSKEFVDSII